jgi:hypothetical protein
MLAIAPEPAYVCTRDTSRTIQPTNSDALNYSAAFTGILRLTSKKKVSFC